MEKTESNDRLQNWRSQSIAKLSTALAKAQAEFPNIEKKKTAEIRSDKGSYSYKYADLADVIAATRPSLSKNELAVLQIIRHEEAKAILQATLTHSSGEWIQSEIEIPRWGTPQALGSLLTYLRRYLYTAIIGVAADEDDDGHTVGASQGNQRPPQNQSRRPQQGPGKEIQEKRGEGAKKEDLPKGEGFKAFLDRFGWTEAQGKEWTTLKFKLAEGQKATPEMILELRKIVQTTPPDQALFALKDGPQ